jgi:hypothetical protein
MWWQAAQYSLVFIFAVIQLVSQSAPSSLLDPVIFLITPLRYAQSVLFVCERRQAILSFRIF